MKNFDTDLTFAEATKRLEGRKLAGADVRRKYLEGDHWQAGEGFIGQKPTSDNPNRAQILADIEAGFQPENVVAEVVGRHVDGVLGREPTWDFIPAEAAAPRVRARSLARRRREQSQGAPAPAPPEDLVELMEEADAALVSWWDDFEVLLTLQKACSAVLVEQRAVLRLYVTGGRDDAGQLRNASSLAEAFSLIRLEVLTPETAGVFTDADTGRTFSAYSYKDDDNRQLLELSYLDDDTDTVLRVIDNAGQQIAAAEPPLKLGGRLLLCEVTRTPIITDSVIRNQKALNLANTMMMRNVNMAGSRERWFFNTQPPGEWVDDPTAPEGRRFVKGTLKVGPGSSNFPRGAEIRDETTGELKGYANPNLQVLEPVKVESFTETRDQFYAAIIGQCWQRYALISGDATASGRSREQARAEFEMSLKKTKTSFDAAGRWLVETALGLAAEIAGRPGDFLSLRAQFDTILYTGPISTEERTANREDVNAGLMSDETAMVRAGHDDPDAERARIESQPPRTEQQPPTNPPRQDPPSGGGLQQ